MLQKVEPFLDILYSQNENKALQRRAILEREQLKHQIDFFSLAPQSYERLSIYRKKKYIYSTLYSVWQLLST